MNFHPLVLLLHVLGATVWTGGHLVLALAVLPRALREGSHEPVRAFEEGFEKVGVPALVLQVATGLWLAKRWLGSLGAIFALETPHARAAAFKLGVLAVTVILAVDARVRIVPRLGAHNLRALAWHIVPGRTRRGKTPGEAGHGLKRGMDGNEAWTGG